MTGTRLDPFIFLLGSILIFSAYVAWCRYKPKWRPCANGNHRWPKHKKREKKIDKDGNEYFGDWIETEQDEWSPLALTWFESFRICKKCGMLQRKKPDPSNPEVLILHDSPLGDWNDIRARFS